MKSCPASLFAYYVDDICKIAMRKEYDELNDMLFEQYELTRREAEALNIEIENMSEAKKRLHEIKVAIKGLGSINVGAIEEYKEVSERYEFLKEQKNPKMSF